MGFLLKELIFALFCGNSPYHFFIRILLSVADDLSVLCDFAASICKFISVCSIFNDGIGMISMEGLFDKSLFEDIEDSRLLFPSDRLSF